jgi:hypothetical protein
MSFTFDPPLRLRTDPPVIVRDLDQAAEVVRRYARDHADKNAEGVLHRIEGAAGGEEERDAGLAFRAWAETAGLLELP